MSSSLRVASYNLRDLKDDPRAAARVVWAIAPDVLCLQEVPRMRVFAHRISDFAAGCGLYWSGGSHGSGGTTVLTSLRVGALRCGHERLEVRRLDRERGYAKVQVQVPGRQPITVLSVHLSLKQDERARHAAVVLGSTWAPTDGALVIAGDLNEGPDGPAWQAFASRLNVVTGEAPTFPSRAPDHRLDVIFASPQLRPAVPLATVRVDATDLRAATDHLPVWTDLDLSSLALR